MSEIWILIGNHSTGAKPNLALIFVDKIHVANDPIVYFDPTGLDPAAQATSGRWSNWWNNLWMWLEGVHPYIVPGSEFVVGAHCLSDIGPILHRQRDLHNALTAPGTDTGPVAE